jgi:hypothetical protein
MIDKDVIRLNDDVFKLKKEVYENKLFLNPTKEQEDSFYIKLDSFLNRISYILNENNDKTEEIKRFIMKLDFKNDRDYMNYDIAKNKENLVKIYEECKDIKREPGINFISHCEPVVFYPIRIITEKMMRTFFNKCKDESLNNFFEEMDI